MFDIEIFNGLLEFYYHAYLFSMFSVRDFHPCPNKYFITIIILKYRSCTIDFGTSYRTHFNFFTNRKELQLWVTSVSLKTKTTHSMFSKGFISLLFIFY